MDLHSFDGILINTSGGKDSQTALRQVMKMVVDQGYPLDRVEAVHADLGRMEWDGVPELAAAQVAEYGIEFSVVRRRTQDGDETTTLLDYVRDRQRWPSSTARYCTSEYKRGPCNRTLTALDRRVRKLSGLGRKDQTRILNVFGFRAQESPARKKMINMEIDDRSSSQTRTVYRWLPIHDWTEAAVWADIKASGIPSHEAYSLGMPRLSCVFCIFAPKAALQIAGRAKPELLQEYVDLEAEIGHTFRKDLSLADVQKSINDNEAPDLVDLDGSWNM